MIISLPLIRVKNHDLFEIVSRFGNWLSLLFFWLEIFFFTHTFLPIYSVPLLFLTFLILFPWLCLKKVPLQAKALFKHVALAKFAYGTTSFAGSSTDLSCSPLLEWYSFASIPALHGHGFRLLISCAGDWTGNFIDRKPKHIW